MYFSKKNNFYHGIMFHHFHDNKKHKKSQGSISKDEFYKIIKFVGRKNILNAKDFLLRYKENKLKPNHLCLTFDDAIKCQYDIALPLLEDLKIKSFFFIYSSLFENKPDLLEVYRYFRTNYFKNLNEFYNFFFKICDKDLKRFYIKENKKIKSIKSKFPFYSMSDIKFRLIRDRLLSKEDYEKIMLKMFNEKNFEPKKYFDLLFLKKKDLFNINKLGHSVGLHSHNHPTLFENLDYKDQLSQYKNNQKILSKILKCNKNNIKSMSHPNGSYNVDTFKVLKKLGIELGFKQIMNIDRNMKKINNSKYEIARQDHAHILRMMK